ncbi:MAG: TatD family hydrolase [Myxococcota bacterium]
MLIDSHAHLDSFGDELPQILQRARLAGVERIITIGASDGLGPNHKAVEIARAHPQVFAAVGVHPHDARIVDQAALDTIEALAQDPKVVAIGETGLDFHYKHSTPDEQRRAFVSFIELGLRVNKPIVVHTREADQETAAILRDTGARAAGGVIHCFSGTAALAAAAIDLGFFVSFSGILTFKAADELRAIAKDLPRDRVLVETDCPFLAPIPHRGKRNEPAFVALTAERLAELWEVPVAEVQATTSANAARLFRLPTSVG